jgi:hypothetical protein
VRIGVQLPDARGPSSHSKRFDHSVDPVAEPSVCSHTAIPVPSGATAIVAARTSAVLPERLSLGLALRFLRHEARTQTIRTWTGLQETEHLRYSNPQVYKTTLTLEFGTLTVTMRLFDRSNARPEETAPGGPTTPEPTTSDRKLTCKEAPAGTT